MVHMLTGYRKKGGSSFLIKCIQEACVFTGHTFKHWQYKDDGWGDPGVCHHRGYFHSLFVPSARLQQFFPVCSSPSYSAQQAYK